MIEATVFVVGLVLAAGFFDFIRGTTRLKAPVTIPERIRYWVPKPLACLMIGLCVASIAPVPDQLPEAYETYIFLAIALGVGTMAMILGVGNAIGPAIDGVQPATVKTEFNPGPERWQFGPLLKNAWLSLAALGFLWGAPTLILLFGTPLGWVPAVAFIVATPAALWIARTCLGGPVLPIEDTDPQWPAESKRSNKIWALFNALRSALAVALCATGLILSRSCEFPL
jgi:hypothetical protein